MFDTVEMLEEAIKDINALILQGVMNWKHATDAIGRIGAVIEDLKKKEEAKTKAYNEALEEARKNREQAKKEAAERGETIHGGETINIDLTTGKQETIIE